MEFTVCVKIKIKHARGTEMLLLVVTQENNLGLFSSF